MSNRPKSTFALRFTDSLVWKYTRKSQKGSPIGCFIVNYNLNEYLALIIGIDFRIGPSLDGLQSMGMEPTDRKLSIARRSIFILFLIHNTMMKYLFLNGVIRRNGRCGGPIRLCRWEEKTKCLSSGLNSDHFESKNLFLYIIMTYLIGLLFGTTNGHK